ncbi:arrestin domain-containing protein 1a isoform X2 [Corythoichthys intestinalis]|uniref:arrestin domain-containing protein 1a isoform X2 n=1 Tax=Corythoichthys intestinalis TaxID=161448 RepID=UPI0025A5728E|nr:arrestin domain-containing protein 1a isoform X2 [Corythoichthys intestinalis]
MSHHLENVVMCAKGRVWKWLDHTGDARSFVRSVFGTNMGKIDEFELKFDSSKEFYSPGEYISGTVTIKVGQKLQCKVKVNCNGFCGITNKLNETTWTLEEQYFNNTVSIADKGTLKPGNHTFPFKFLIPGSVPTSFTGNYGRIVYRIRAFIDTPRFSKDYSTEKAFFLLDALNLNKIPEIWGPCSSSVVQEFTYMLLKTGKVMLTAQTDKKGYIPGQIIQLSATVHNKSEKSTGNISASLVQRVTYHTKRPTHDLRAIAELEGGRVKAGKEMEWKEQIIVPPLPQSNLAGCELIKIEYYVKVSLKSPQVLLTLPLQIGNISLDNRFKPSQNEAHLTPANVENPSPLLASAPTLSPPPTAPKPTPRAAPRARLSHPNHPNAPLAEYQPGAEGGTLPDGNFTNKRNSQLVSPTGFSYAPGLSFLNRHQNQSGVNPEGTPIGASTRTPTSYSNVNTASSVLTPASMPPDYRNVEYPQEAPPSYDESCNT